MSSVSNPSQLVTVPFHGNKLFIVEHNNEPYTPMKPIVEGMGLDWGTQYRKLAGNMKRWGIVKMTIPTLGDLQEAICLPLRKIFGWLMTISPNKVKPEVKPTIEMYQNECDDVLWQYWNNKLKTNSDQRTPLRRACDRLAVSNMLTSDAYKIVWEQYGVSDIDQIPLDKLPEAVAFVYEMLLRLKSADIKPAQNQTIPTDPHESEEFKHLWKMIGLYRYDESSTLLSELGYNLRQAQQQLEQVIKCQSYIFDALNQPRHRVGGSDKLREINDKALASIEMQNAIKR